MVLGQECGGARGGTYASLVFAGRWSAFVPLMKFFDPNCLQRQSRGRNNAHDTHNNDHYSLEAMSTSLYDLLREYLPSSPQVESKSQTQDASGYLSRILSLRVIDLTTTEPESLQQASQSNNVSIQALSSRSHRTTTISFDHLTTLGNSLRQLETSTTNIRNAVPELDDNAVAFASSYNKSKENNSALEARKSSMLLARQADKLQDILELPALLSTAIASASTTTAGGANYSKALDLFAHIKRLQLLFPESVLVQSVQLEAQRALKDMTTNLITALRGQNIRLAAAIRTIGWLRRVLPELGFIATSPVAPSTATSFSVTAPAQQDEDDFGAIFLCARLCTFLNMTEALAPLRDLADQESKRRLEHHTEAKQERSRRPSHGGYAAQGQQTERYLKRYIEIFREQSFATIQMFRNIFPTEGSAPTPEEEKPLQLPSSLKTFPLQLVEIFMETVETYLPNVVDSAARESLLMQVLYAANSLGRLGADFSMMIAFLEQDLSVLPDPSVQEAEQHRDVPNPTKEPEWVGIIQKHRVQAARLEALSAGQDQAMKRASSDVTVKYA
jgi:conserved oligomeric Golgi complex subunit 8